MIKLYLIILIGALCVVFYFYGFNVGNSKCNIQHYQKQIQTSYQNEKEKRIIHDTVYKTGLDDVRRVLRDKYSISQ